MLRAYICDVIDQFMDLYMRHQRQDYRYFISLDTRWSDNDVYGHVNNVTYYSYFDTAANRLLIEHAGFDFLHSPLIGLVVKSGCEYFQALAYPEKIHIGVRVAHLGRSSLGYEIAIFKDHQDAAAAQGHFTHVFVDRETRRSQEIPSAMREALSRFIVTTP